MLCSARTLHEGVRTRTVKSRSTVESSAWDDPAWRAFQPLGVLSCGTDNSIGLGKLDMPRPLRKIQQLPVTSAVCAARAVLRPTCCRILDIRCLISRSFSDSSCQSAESLLSDKSAPI